MLISRYLIVNGYKAIAILILVYCELIAFNILPFRWPNRQECLSPECLKILLVADPQILGQQDSWFIERWDADRYLGKTFNKALKYVQPDLLIFLGDLMDEGHIATDDEFVTYYDRFNYLFDIPEGLPPLTTVYVPGDNDIGGEEDPIFPQIVHRFDRMFDQNPDPILYQTLEIIKVNKMTEMFQEPDELHSAAIRIALSHMPLLRRIHTLGKRVASAIKPHVIFSGHDHEAVHVTAPLKDVWRKTTVEINPYINDWLEIDLSNEDVHELTVPTCSYRMGVMDVGFGVVYLNVPSKTLTYTVLWLPSRLNHLRTYLCFIIATVVFAMCLLLVLIKRRIQRLIQALHPGKLIAQYKQFP